MKRVYTEEQKARRNLAHALGCDDLTPYLADIEDKNRKRGRYEDK